MLAHEYGSMVDAKIARHYKVDIKHAIYVLLKVFTNVY